MRKKNIVFRDIVNHFVWVVFGLYVVTDHGMKYVINKY